MIDSRETPIMDYEEFLRKMPNGSGRGRLFRKPIRWRGNAFSNLQKAFTTPRADRDFGRGAIDSVGQWTSFRISPVFLVSRRSRKGTLLSMGGEGWARGNKIGVRKPLCLRMGATLAVCQVDPRVKALPPQRQLLQGDRLGLLLPGHGDGRLLPLHPGPQAPTGHDLRLLHRGGPGCGQDRHDRGLCGRQDKPAQRQRLRLRLQGLQGLPADGGHQAHTGNPLSPLDQRQAGTLSSDHQGGRQPGPLRGSVGPAGGYRRLRKQLQPPAVPHGPGQCHTRRRAQRQKGAAPTGQKGGADSDLRTQKALQQHPQRALSPLL